MTQAFAPQTGSAADAQPIGAVQIRVAVICGLIQMCDGYEIGSIGWAAPSLIQDWHIPPSSLALIFLASNIGMIAGATASGPVGDRFGRKPLLLLSLGLFGLASLATALADSIPFLVASRFFTGVGVAGGFSGATALTGDFSPARFRATMIMLSVTGAPFGGFLGGQIAALLLSEGSNWQSIFLIGGVFPLVLLVISAMTLPESARFALEGSTLPAAMRLRGALRWRGGGNPVRMLFTDGYAAQTVPLWIIFFCSLLNVYLFVFWLPQILHLIGFSNAEAVFATSVQTLGGVSAVLYLGWVIDRLGARALAIHFAAGVLCTVILALSALPYIAVLILVFLSGVTVIGSQTGLNAACGKLYPARMRATGYGCASGIGRLGGIAAAPLGGLMLANGWPPNVVLLSACLFAAVAAGATLFLRIPGADDRAA